MEEKKDMHKMQFWIDDNLFKKWQTFQLNNKSVFANGSDLFRYAVNNIEVLAAQNVSLVSKEVAKIEKLEQENIELKKELYDLKKSPIENKEYDNEIRTMLNNLLEEVSVLEMLASTQMVASGNRYRIQEPKNSSLYREAKEKINNTDTRESASKYRRPF